MCKRSRSWSSSNDLEPLKAVNSRCDAAINVHVSYTSESLVRIINIDEKLIGNARNERKFSLCGGSRVFVPDCAPNCHFMLFSA